MNDISELIGKTMVEVKMKGDDQITFVTDSWERYRLYHDQSCCEHVDIDDIIGDLSDLVGSPIIMAEESTNSDKPRDEGDESWTWTFYKFATVKGYVTIRWYGSSTGYYSERVDFEKVGT